MKIIGIENNYSPAASDSTQAWFVLADSAITNTGKPFYIPENVGRVNVSPGIALRINRLGKHIAPRFAGRYYSEHVPVLLFSLPDMEADLRSKGLPTDASRNFDRALFAGDFKSRDELEELALYKNKDKVSLFSLCNLVLSIENIISRVSEINTLKIGDLIIPALGESVNIDIDDFLEVVCNDELLFHVKVK